MCTCKKCVRMTPKQYEEVFRTHLDPCEKTCQCEKFIKPYLSCYHHNFSLPYLGFVQFSGSFKCSSCFPYEKRIVTVTCYIIWGNCVIAVAFETVLPRKYEKLQLTQLKLTYLHGHRYICILYAHFTHWNSIYISFDKFQGRFSIFYFSLHGHCILEHALDHDHLARRF